MMRRTYWVVMAAVPSVLLAADIAYWRIASERLRGGLQDWIAARRAGGWEIEAGPVALGGWPRAAAISLPSLHMRHAGTDVPGDLEWSSSGLALSVALYLPNDIDVRFSGPQHLRIANAPDIVVTAGTMGAVVPLRQDGPSVIDLHANALRVEPAAGPWHVTAGLLDAHGELSPAGGARESGQVPQSVTFAVSMEAIALPAGFKWALGRNISSLSTRGALNGPFPPAGEVSAWAQAWRDGGGSLEINHLAMGWGPLGLTSSATLALDDQLQPMGSGSARVVGYADSLDRLAAAGMLTKSAVIAAKAVLSLMAGTGDTDEPAAVDVPLTLQYRTLSMRQVPLVRLPELDWPPR